MQYDNKTTRSVADAVFNILSGQTVSEELKGNQHKIDANKNNKIDAEDFELLRKKKKVEEETELAESHFKVGDKVKCKSSGMKGEVVKLDKDHGAEDDKYYTVKRDDGTMKKMAPEDMTKMNEDVDQLDELSKSTLGSYVNKASDGAAKSASSSTSFAFRSTAAKNPRVKAAAAKISDEEDAKRQKRLSGIGKAVSRLTKEDSEQLDEYEAKQGVYKHKGTYGSAKGAEFGATDYKKENDLAKAADKEKKKPARGAYGARQNFVRSYAKESFSGMMDIYKQGGLKSLHESLVKEEPTNDEFTTEVQNAKDKAALKKKQPDLAKPSVQAVKVEEEYEILDADEINGVEIEDIQERSLSGPEMNKKEEIVMGMKRNLAGFKDRYGDRAKEVLYGAATKIAKKD